ncbi:MAG: hypothetical protein CMF70_06510 [Magnetovibrio sp.]|nr:hypothetical protein [Magnetovibrio sp.]
MDVNPHSSIEQISKLDRFIAGIRATVRHELRLMLYTGLSYLFQIGFLTGLATCIFLIADFYSTDEASVRLLVVFLPWVGMILVPTLAMRSWGDEHSDRSVELSMTLPVAPGAVVLGKFLSGYLVLLVTLIFTLPMVATLFYLGKPDVGILLSSYLGAALTLGFFYALSILAAVITREAIAAFVLSSLTLFILLLLGWDIFGRILNEIFSASFVNLISFFSPYTWLMRMSQGAIELGALIYFLSAIAGALWISSKIVEARYIGTLSVFSFLKVGKEPLFLIVLFTICIPFLSRIPILLDMTEAREFTLHQSTLNAVSGLPKETELTLFWSASEPSTPTHIKSHARRVISLIENIVGQSGSRLIFKQIDPKPDTNYELDALASGIQKIPMSSGDSFFLGLTVSIGSRTGKISYFDYRRARLMEYDIANVLNGISRKNIPKIGILSPLVPSISVVKNREGLSFVSQLKESYDLAIIPHFRSSLPTDLDVLLVINATILQKEMLYSIDQFLMNGGSLIVMMDPYLRFKKTSNKVNPEPSKKINDISDLLELYGLRYLGQSVVGDLDTASMVADKENQRMNYPFWMRIREGGLSSAHATTASLNEVFFVEGGAIEILDLEQGAPLVVTTNASGVLSRYDFLNMAPSELSLNFKVDNRPRTIAAVLQGNFTSAYGTPPKSFSAENHKEKTKASSVVFAISDVDWLFDPFSIQKTNINGKIVVRPLNDNLAFLLNMVEFASGDQSLIAIRSRAKLHRPFDKVASLIKEAQSKLQEEETFLARRVFEIETQIKKFIGNAGTIEFEHMPPKIQNGIINFRKNLLNARLELRTVRARIRENVDRLGYWITFINLISGPLLIGVSGLLVFYFRRKRFHIAFKN